MDEPVHASPRRERRDARENRQRIIAEARELFARQGVDATSMNEIAQQAQVGPATLYRRFAHKGELCVALLQDDFQDFQRQIALLRQESAVTLSPLAQLELLINRLVAMVMRHIPMLAAIQESSSGNRRHEIYLSPFHTWLCEQISELFTQAIARGEIADIDVEFTSQALLAATAPPLIDYLQQERGFTQERIIANTLQLFIKALRTTR